MRWPPPPRVGGARRHPTKSGGVRASECLTRIGPAVRPFGKPPCVARTLTLLRHPANPGPVHFGPMDGRGTKSHCTLFTTTPVFLNGTLLIAAASQIRVSSGLD